MQRTFAMVKPDGVRRGLIGEIISRFEKRGIKVVALKLIQMTPEKAEEHYAEHKGKPFFPSVVEFITSGPVAAMVLEGENVVSAVRTMMGATDPKDSAPGTIRSDYALTMSENIIHGSDSPDSASREIGLFFSEKEIISK